MVIDRAYDEDCIDRPFGEAVAFGIGQDGCTVGRVVDDGGAAVFAVAGTDLTRDDALRLVGVLNADYSTVSSEMVEMAQQGLKPRTPEYVAAYRARTRSYSN